MAIGELLPQGAAPEDMQADLKGDLEEVKNLRGSVESDSFVGNNQIADLKSGLLKSLLDMIKESGVDVNSLESISEFLQKLSEQDPDLAELFQHAFQSLSGIEQPPLSGGEQQAPGGLPGAPEGLPGAMPGPGGPTAPLGEPTTGAPGGLPQSPTTGGSPLDNSGMMSRFNNMADKRV